MERARAIELFTEWMALCDAYPDLRREDNISIPVPPAAGSVWKENPVTRREYAHTFKEQYFEMDLAALRKALTAVLAQPLGARINFAAVLAEYGAVATVSTAVSGFARISVSGSEHSQLDELRFSAVAPGSSGPGDAHVHDGCMKKFHAHASGAGARGLGCLPAAAPGAAGAREDGPELETQHASKRRKLDPQDETPPEIGLRNRRIYGGRRRTVPSLSALLGRYVAAKFDERAHAKTFFVQAIAGDRCALLPAYACCLCSYRTRARRLTMYYSWRARSVTLVAPKAKPDAQPRVCSAFELLATMASAYAWLRDTGESNAGLVYHDECVVESGDDLAIFAVREVPAALDGAIDMLVLTVPLFYRDLGARDTGAYYLHSLSCAAALF